MKINLTFSHNYYIEILKEQNFTDNVYYYPLESNLGGRDGLMIEVTSEDGNFWWQGVFAFGMITTKGISGVYSMPNPDEFCVISRGHGYLVSYDNPKKIKEISSTPIMDIRVIKSLGIIIFASYTDLIAYDKEGIKWCSGRVSYDNFKIIEVTKTHLKGEFWNIRNESYDIFLINLLTGFLELGEIIKF